jgi:hypothetical protein
MDLNLAVIFVRVVEAGSFSAAAAALGLPKSSVSRAVARLEDLDAHDQDRGRESTTWQTTSSPSRPPCVWGWTSWTSLDDNASSACSSSASS